MVRLCVRDWNQLLVNTDIVPQKQNSTQYFWILSLKNTTCVSLIYFSVHVVAHRNALNIFYYEDLLESNTSRAAY